MSQSIGDLFVSLGFKVDDTPLKSFDESLKSVFGTALKVAGVGGGIAGFALALNQVADNASKIQNLNTQLGVTKQFAEGFAAAFHEANPLESFSAGLDIAGNMAKYAAAMQQGLAGQELGYFGGNFADNTPEKIFDRLRSGYETALTMANGNRALVSQWVSTITGSAGVLNMVLESSEELNKSWSKGIFSDEKQMDLHNYNKALSDISNSFDQLKASWLSVPAKQIADFLKSPEIQNHPETAAGAAGGAALIGTGVASLLGFGAITQAGLFAGGGYMAGSALGTYLKENGWALDLAHATMPGLPGNNKPFGLYKRGDYTDAGSQLGGYGWDKDHVNAIMKRLMVESGLNPAAVGDNGAAYGIAQWHPDRQADFAKIMGKDIHGSSVQEQLDFLNYELTKGNEQKAGARFRAAKGDAAYASFTNDYERPAVSVVIHNSFGDQENPQNHADIVNRQVINSAYANQNIGGH